MAENMMASAAAAYAKINDQVSKMPTAGLEEPQDTGFSDLLKQAVQEATNIGYKSERATVAAAAGAADVNEVITAVAEAEVTLQAVTTVRDRVIQAYQDIIKMPI